MKTLVQIKRINKEIKAINKRYDSYYDLSLSEEESDGVEISRANEVEAMTQDFIAEDYIQLDNLNQI
jgi:hypothetical protein